jgi:hypothetical protein
MVGLGLWHLTAEILLKVGLNTKNKNLALQ